MNLSVSEPTKQSSSNQSLTNQYFSQIAGKEHMYSPDELLSDKRICHEPTEWQLCRTNQSLTNHPEQTPKKGKMEKEKNQQHTHRSSQITVHAVIEFGKT